MVSRKLTLLTVVALAALIVPASPVRVQAPAGLPQLPACAKTGYTADVDGAPNKGVCREFVDQAKPVLFNIPPGSLFNGIKAFLEQAGARGWIPLGLDLARICPDSSAAKRPLDCPIGSLQTAGVTGMMTPRQALEKLLAGTGTTFVQDQTGTYRFPPLQEAPTPGGRCIWDKSPPTACPG